VDRPDHTDGASHIRRRSGIGYRTRGSRHVFHWQLSNRARRTGRAAWSLLRPDSRGQCCRIRAAIERSGRRRRLRSELTSCSAR
jgi:hypothetical protein